VTCVNIREFQLAAGNNNAAGLQVLIDKIASRAPWPRVALGIQSYQNYDNGIARITGAGTAFVSGFPSIIWRLSAVTWEQEEYIRDTYCSGGLSGLVTVRTNTNDLPEVFANYDAVLSVNKFVDSDIVWRRFRNYEMRFSRLVAL